jgi:tRNA-guanine family transglycosylase
MGKLINFCAGADIKALPTENVPALLLNALDHGSTIRKIKIAKEMCRMANSKYTMFDSSGYQLLKGEEKGKRLTFNPNLPMKHNGREINLAPRHVMETAPVFQSDIVIGLDNPIRKLKTVAEKMAEFKRKLNYNVRWAFESAAEWKERCPEAKFFLPIQCYDIEQLDLFLSKTDGLCYDGVSMPIRNLKIPEIALFLVSFYQRGIKQVHLLGTSSFPRIALCAYAAHHMFEWVSLDATTWRLAADMGEFLNPWNLSRVKLSPRINISADKPNNCPCPFCDGMNFAAIQGLERKKKIRLLREHNWWSVGKAFFELAKHSVDIIEIEKLMRTGCRTPRMAETVDTLIKTLSLVETFKDWDIDTLEKLLSPKPIISKKSSPRLQTAPA